jgi:hypothetical protein
MRHSLDELQCSRRFQVGPASAAEVTELIATASPAIPTMRIVEPAVRRIHERDPDTIIAVRGRRGLAGGGRCSS